MAPHGAVKCSEWLIHGNYASHFSCSTLSRLLAALLTLLGARVINPFRKNRGIGRNKREGNWPSRLGVGQLG